MRKIILYVAMVWSVLAAIPCWSTTLKVEKLSEGFDNGVPHDAGSIEYVQGWRISPLDDGCVIYDIKNPQYLYTGGYSPYWYPVQSVQGLGTDKVTLWVNKGSYYSSRGWRGDMYVRCHGAPRSVVIDTTALSEDGSGGARFGFSIYVSGGGQSATAEVNDLNFSISQSHGCTAYQTIGRVSSDTASLTGTIVGKPDEPSLQLEMVSDSGELRSRVCNTGSNVGAGRYSWMVTVTLAMK